MVAERVERYLTRVEQEQHRRTFQCGRCTTIAGIDGFLWSRHTGITCRRCRRFVYVLAERGPSPYAVWPFREQAPLTDMERFRLLTDHRDDDGMLFLSLDDIPLYQRLRQELQEARQQ